MAANFAFVDGKVGLSTGGPRQIATTLWAINTAYAVGNVVQNGGFSFRCSVAGTSLVVLNVLPQSSGPSPTVLVDNGVTWTYLAALSSLAVQDATQQQELGYQALAKDPTFGMGTFRYVKFNGICNPGDWVIVDQSQYLASQTPIAAPGVSKVSFLGISMGKQIVGSWGWVMIQGVHDQANVAAAGAVGSTLQGSAVLGQASTGVVANYIFDATALRNAGVAGAATVEIYWPVCSGR